MAIKKRTPQEQQAAMDAFAEGADQEQPPAVRPVPRDSEPRNDDSDAVSLKMLLRFPNDELPKKIQRLAAEEDRSRHNFALRALARGLQAIEDDHQQ